MNIEIDTRLETLVDDVGLTGIVNALSEICLAKAEHLRANWQDESSAEIWERDAAALSEVTLSLEN